MLVLNLPFKALMFLTLMRPSLVLFLVLWLKLVKDFLKVRCRLALLPFLIRSEERRVGKECRSGLSPGHEKKFEKYYNECQPNTQLALKDGFGVVSSGVCGIRITIARNR